MLRLFARLRFPLVLQLAAVVVLTAGYASFADHFATVFPSGVSDRSQREPTLSGRPTHITDGDTIRFGRTRVRLHGIQAPEMDTADGPRSRAALIELIGQGEISCEDTGQRSYRRVVARCFDAQGRDLSARMVRAGWATDWPRFSSGRYAIDQLAATAGGRGLHSR